MDDGSAHPFITPMQILRHRDSTPFGLNAVGLEGLGTSASGGCLRILLFSERCTISKTKIDCRFDELGHCLLMAAPSLFRDEAEIMDLIGTTATWKKSALLPLFSLILYQLEPLLKLAAKNLCGDGDEIDAPVVRAQSIISIIEERDKNDAFPSTCAVLMTNTLRTWRSRRVMTSWQAFRRSCTTSSAPGALTFLRCIIILRIYSTVGIALVLFGQDVADCSK